MNDAERLEEIESILDEIDAFDGYVIVEGRNDIRALRSLGVSADLICVQRDGGPLRIAEFLSEEGKDGMILTDWDRKGDDLSDELGRCLSGCCVRYDTGIRKRLREVCIKDIKDVESLDTLYVRIKNYIDSL